MLMLCLINYISIPSYRIPLVIMLALVNNEPKILNILQMLNYYLDHQKEVVSRRTKYDLNKAEERAHILQGLLIALDHIDEVIKIIRGSQNGNIAKERLIERFGLSDASTSNNRYEASCTYRSEEKT